MEAPAYDAAKRPTQATKTVGGSSISFTQAYDRRGNVTSEGRSLTTLTGDKGTGLQTFSYDALSRLTGSSGLASGSRTYTYDLDGNVTRRTEGALAYDFTYEPSDQVRTVQKTGGSLRTFAHDAYGNLLTDYEAGGSSPITHAYDAGDRLVSITPSAGPASTFAYDALGRIRTKVTATTPSGTTDTFAYAGAAEWVVGIVTTGDTSATLASLVDPAGTRLGALVGTDVRWAVPDLHGNAAAWLAGDEASVSEATRYDGYGLIVDQSASPSAGARSWKYQGRLDLSPAQGTTDVLYAAGARRYAPALASFTQLDSYRGSAQDPFSLNRHLYAAANPATLIDPTGHCATAICNKDGIGEPDWAMRRAAKGPGAGTRAWLDDHARVVAGWRTARTLARAAAIARTPAVRAALGRSGASATARAAEVARTAEVQADMAAYQPSAAEAIAMGVGLLGSTLLGTAGAAALVEGAAALGSTARATGSGFVADVSAGLVTAGPAGACAMGGCAALQAVGGAIESALTGGGTPSNVAARAGAAVVDDVAAAAAQVRAAVKAVEARGPVSLTQRQIDALLALGRAGDDPAEAAGGVEGVAGDDRRGGGAGDRRGIGSRDLGPVALRVVRVLGHEVRGGILRAGTGAGGGVRRRARAGVGAVAVGDPSRNVVGRYGIVTMRSSKRPG